MVPVGVAHVLRQLTALGYRHQGEQARVYGEERRGRDVRAELVCTDSVRTGPVASER